MTWAAASGPGPTININGQEQVDWELSGRVFLIDILPAVYLNSAVKHRVGESTGGGKCQSNPPNTPPTTTLCRSLPSPGNRGGARRCIVQTRRHSGVTWSSRAPGDTSRLCAEEL